MSASQVRRAVWLSALALVLFAGLALRLQGIGNPLLDRPAWRQGDTASIARNFAALRYNILYPQTNYDGPPPNYVELELQIVPFLAATVYKIAGVHEIAGRLITLAFSLGTIAVLAFFGRWLFASATAGILAGLFYAIMPGSIYYGRTFTPDAAMVFFLTGALYAIARLAIDDERWRARKIVWCTFLLSAALLAKPVAIVALVPVAVLLYERVRSGRTLQSLPMAIIVALPLFLLYAYDATVAAHAQWHWVSGILTLHVLPALRASLQNGTALVLKLAQSRAMLGLLVHVMTGPVIASIAIAGFLFPPAATRSRSLLWAWLAGGLAYIYVVVTVERVDYYMFLLLPLTALTAAGFTARLTDAVAGSALGRPTKYVFAAAALLALAAITYESREIVKPYYAYSQAVYRHAIALNKTLDPGALIVMGHYDPSILYYIGRYGWEEDPYLWTPFDEQSAIHKGARYFITIEKNRFNRNVELCAWMQRFPISNSRSLWPVYVTDPAQVRPGAEKQWRAFRNAEKAGHARAWLDAHGLCTSVKATT